MKLIIQIPCFNEEETLPLTLKDLPSEIPGIDEIETLIIDDGSTDRTRAVAVDHGVNHVVGFPANRGLARAFGYGLNACIERGADIIVNTDADNQYNGADIPKLVQPILEGRADMVIGDRQTHTIGHFSKLKKILQKHGSFMVGVLAGMKIPDAASGFRAISREAALEMNVISDFSYTLESLIQAGHKRLAVVSVPISTNDKTRESKLFHSMFAFVRRSAATMIRAYTTHQPLKVFLSLSAVFMLMAAILFGRFLIFYISGDSAGHIQSLIFGAAFLIVAGFMAAIGILADLINANRKLVEEVLKIVRDKERSDPPR